MFSMWGYTLLTSILILLNICLFWIKLLHGKFSWIYLPTELNISSYLLNLATRKVLFVCQITKLHNFWFCHFYISHWIRKWVSSSTVQSWHTSICIKVKGQMIVTVFKNFFTKYCVDQDVIWDKSEGRGYQTYF